MLAHIESGAGGPVVRVGASAQARFPLEDYDLETTLTSGQAFRWQRNGIGWEGVVRGKWTRLEASDSHLAVQLATPVADWIWLREYLGLGQPLAKIVETFPHDESMRSAVQACRGLRLLRQEPWECLASFILSSTKQILQIQQCVRLLCERFGEPVAVPDGAAPAYAFPTWSRLARSNEAELRTCKLGFRAGYLLAAARMLEAGQLDLDELSALSTSEARERLVTIPGVGPKIAHCVLLFAYGRQDAFPVDVWILRALKELYYPRRQPKPETLRRFTETYFGPYAGYAQQYLFHYVRTKRGKRER